MGVGFGAVLDAAVEVVEAGADGAGFAIFADDITFAFGHVVNLSDGRDDGRCAASACFFECGEFLFGNWSAFHLHAEVEGQLLKRLVGNAGQYG